MYVGVSISTTNKCFTFQALTPGMLFESHSLSISLRAIQEAVMYACHTLTFEDSTYSEQCQIHFAILGRLGHSHRDSHSVTTRGGMNFGE